MKTEILFALDELKQKAQKRQLRRAEASGTSVILNGKPMLNLASNNYLGLADDQRLIEAGCEAMQRYGAGAGASRLVVGNHPLYERAEAALKQWKKAEAALIFNSGYTANIGVLTALIGRDDLVFSDQLNHASLIDGIRLSKAACFRYRHNDINQLESWLKQSPPDKRKWIVTDAVFSMDGDLAPLSELVELKRRYRAILIVDEAHSGGVFGPNGEGLLYHFGLEKEEDVIAIGTFSKALGSFGAYATGEPWLIDYLMNSARSFIFTTALPPAVLAANEAAIHIVQSEPERRTRLHALSERFRTKLKQLGFDTGGSETPIVPVIVGPNDQAVAMSELLQEAGIAAIAIRPPTVPEGTARIRFSVTAAMTEEDVDRAVDRIAWAGKKIGLIS
ncbi:8-amino-7-oxononanoate synthase [Geobacillus sp. 46C-IIa]|uniref:8-amino-7-oxononanoate synthase n=1 Tax=Geobacillus sp. 46C-IIa TaxID=1963025 RepID=UPI0009BEC267|nr:8-amino-7-oxononanoate synthase [Geobacillus sp. 46C-IIa]OQP05501.1 8-amino-7-oxononanoate synthase [Geobacillus sp. 46C-IIa]QNU29139.1 8-amino-7-oxononanoate synthase [Geobacillus sp. 46C-IIa]